MRNNRFNVFRDGLVHVQEKMCETCIYKPNSPILTETRQQMQDEALKDETAIVCHSTLDCRYQAICRGYANSVKEDSLMLRMAEAFGLLRKVRVETTSKL